MDRFHKGQFHHKNKRIAVMAGILSAIFFAGTVFPQPIAALDYSSGTNYTADISGSEDLVILYDDAAPPATQSGDITGTAADTLTITGPQGGTLNLRGDNTGFAGTVTFTNGVLNINASGQLFGRMAGFSFAGNSVATTQPTLQIAAGSAIAIDGNGTSDQRLILTRDTAGAFDLQTGATLTWRNSAAGTGGAIYVNQGSRLTLAAESDASYLFSDNSSTGDGGALAAASSILEVENATFSNNISGRYGGALYSGTLSGVVSEITLADTTFSHNESRSDGGAVMMSSSNLNSISTLVGDGLTFTSNNSTGGNGGAIRNGLSDVTLTNSTFTANTAYGNGGAISNNNTLYIADSAFTGNYSRQHGGAIYNYYNSTSNNIVMDLERTDFTGNYTGSGGRGGAIYIQEGTLNLEDVNFTANTAGWNGGAIFQWNGATTLTVTDGATSTFSGNSDRDGSNAIYVYASGKTATLDIDVGTGATLDMRDALSGAAGSYSTAGDIEIAKTGDGLWNLGGDGVFASAAGGATTVAINGGTLHLYGLNESGGVEAGHLDLQGSASTFTLGAGATLSVGGNNNLSAGGGIFFRNGSTVTGGDGPNNSTKLNFSPATLGGDVSFRVDDADQTLVLNGTFTGGTGSLVKVGAGEVLLTRTGNAVDSVQLNEGTLGFVVGSDANAVNIIANSVTLATGTMINVSGFNASALGESVTLVQSVDDIVGDVGVYEVGGEIGGVDYLSALLEKTADNKSIVAQVGLTWYAQPSEAHGTFTLGTTRSAFILGTVLADRSGVFPAQNWDGKSLTKKGLGMLTLTAANTYSGDTNIEEGILSITNLQGTGVNAADKMVAISAPGTLQLDIDAASSGEYRKTLIGTGMLVKQGDGRVVMTADNSGFSGAVAIAGGALVAANADSLGTGDVDVTGELELAYDGQFVNIVGGTGLLTTRGDLILSGDHTAHTGTAVAASGTLRLADTFVSGAAYEVASGATLSGEGTVGSLLVRAGGFLEPGDNYEHMEVTGDATFQTGSSYMVALNGNGSESNEIEVGGTVTIEEGARLAVRQGGQSRLMPVGQIRYRIIAADDFADDTLFDMGAASRIGFDLEQELATDGLYLTTTYKTPGFGNLVSGVGTPNAIRAGEALDRLVASGDALNLGGLYDALIGLEDDPFVAANALAQLHGEVFASTQFASANLQRNFLRTSRSGRDRTASFCPPSGPGGLYTLWASFTASWLDRDRIGRGYSGFVLRAQGIALGMDRQFGDFFGGVAFGYDHGRQKFDDIHSRAEFDAFRSLLYGGYRRDTWRVDTHVGYSKTWQKTRRHVDIGDWPDRFAATARSRFDDNIFTAGIEVRRVFDLGGFTVSPGIGLDWVRVHSPSVRERDAAEAGLAVDSRTYNSLQMPVGVQVGWEYAGNGLVLRPEARAHYQVELADASAKAATRFQYAPSQTFYARTGNLGRHSARFGLGVATTLRDRVQVRVDYDLEVGKKSLSNELRLGVSLDW